MGSYASQRANAVVWIAGGCERVATNGAADAGAVVEATKANRRVGRAIGAEFAKLVAQCQSVLGEDHPFTLKCLSGQAQANLLQGQHAEAADQVAGQAELVHEVGVGSA